jgi:Cu/Ag efflux pump CusA
VSAVVAAGFCFFFSAAVGFVAKFGVCSLFGVACCRPL